MTRPIFRPRSQRAGSHPPRPSKGNTPSPREKERRGKDSSSGEVIGRVQFRTGGSAFVIPEGPSDPSRVSIQIGPDDTGVALPGDRVSVRVLAGRTGRRAGEAVGRITRIVERTRDIVVG